MTIKGHFALETPLAYNQWREEKLSHYPSSIDELIVEINDPKHLAPSEQAQLLCGCRRSNFAIYHTPLTGVADKEIPTTLGRQLGLARLDQNPFADDDAISALTVSAAVHQQEFIPYTNQPLQWHTDGYYNATECQIGGFILHCVHPALSGGENALIDPEMLYIQLRDQDPVFIQALMANDVMIIPPYIDSDGVEQRPQRSGPIFSIDPRTHALRMRYTQRKRHVIWKQDSVTKEALACLTELLNDDQDYLFRYTLQGGQGLICNNVLHNRSAFKDAPEPNQQRLLYRARYYDRIMDT